MKHLGWLSSGTFLVFVALLIFSVPDSFEGPLLKSISKGHAIHLVDAIAIVPLVVGSACLLIGLQIRRERLWVRVRESPGVGISTSFVSGAGLGLLLASAFSDFWWWWALGAGLFAATVILASIATTRHSRDTHEVETGRPTQRFSTDSTPLGEKDS